MFILQKVPENQNLEILQQTIAEIKTEFGSKIAEMEKKILSQAIEIQKQSQDINDLKLSVMIHSHQQQDGIALTQKRNHSKMVSTTENANISTEVINQVGLGMDTFFVSCIKIV